MDWNGFWSIDLSEWCALKYRKCMTQIRPNMSLECSFTFFNNVPMLVTADDDSWWLLPNQMLSKRLAGILACILRPSAVWLTSPCHAAWAALCLLPNVLRNAAGRYFSDALCGPLHLGCPFHALQRKLLFVCLRQCLSIPSSSNSSTEIAVLQLPSENGGFGKDAFRHKPCVIFHSLKPPHDQSCHPTWFVPCPFVFPRLSPWSCCG